MFESDLVRRRIEIGEIATPHFDRADAKAHLAGIDSIEIDHTLQRRSQRRVVVIARFIWTSRWPDGRRRQARHKEIRRPKQENAYGTVLIDKLMLVVAELDLPEIGNAKRRSRDRAPKLAQRVDATLRRIAGNDRGIDGADRDSGNPIGMQISLGQRLVNTRLIGAE